MSANSKIEWTESTWNPVLGCDKVSVGCKNCYAIRTAYRLQHNPNQKVKAAFEGLTVMQGGQPNWTGRINFVPDRLEEPLHWAKPRRVFVNSQSDLFHEGIYDEQIDQVFAVMSLAEQHTFQILTKRPERMLHYLSCKVGRRTIVGNNAIWTHSASWPLRNVWLGVSCENQATADERIPLLLQTPAAVRWVSAEPLLGPIDLQNRWTLTGEHRDWLKSAGNACISWVVAGSESGPGARPAELDWYRSLRDQCVASNTPFFLKQLCDKGHKIPTPELDGVRWMQYPERPIGAL